MSHHYHLITCLASPRGLNTWEKDNSRTSDQREGGGYKLYVGSFSYNSGGRQREETPTVVQWEGKGGHKLYFRREGRGTQTR
jgi:hypothetical protein